MKINQFLSIFFLFMTFSVKNSFAGGLIDAARDITAGALNFAGEVVERTGEAVRDVAQGTAEIVRPASYEVIEGPRVERPTYVEGEAVEPGTEPKASVREGWLVPHEKTVITGEPEEAVSAAPEATTAEVTK
jgi:hypothetical protein